jgi:carbonic anhydrase/acetyltransferase-like protein (isoleucine patch superfamily)
VQAFILETGRKIAPFDEAPGEALFAMGTAGGEVSRALFRRGVEVTRVPPGEAVPDATGSCIVLADHCFVTDKCLGDFLAAVLDAAEPQRLALCRTPASEYTRPVSSVAIEPLDESGPGARDPRGGRTDAAATERLAYDCFFVPGGQLPTASDGAALLEKLRRDAVRRVVPKREIVREVRMPIIGDAEHTSMRYPVTSTVAAHLEHWVHILWLNHLAFGIVWMDTIRAHKAWATWRALAAVPYNQPAFFRSFVRKGHNVQIHPTAHVEASVLGDDVVIGPRACVRNSILGPGVEVADNATVLTSVVGEGGYVTPKSFFVWGAAYPEAVISNYKMQMSLVGRRASSSTWAGLIDAKFQGAIEVPHDGAMASTERNFLGSCIGHGAHVGAKVLLMPGRALPNETFLTMRPDELVQRIPDELQPGVPVVRHEGTLVPLEELLAQARARREAVPAAAATQEPPANK